MKKSLYWISSLWCYSALCSADFLVTTTSDSGPGSLREAMLSLGSGGDLVTFDPLLAGQTITLLSPLPTIASNVSINPAATGPFVKIDGTGAHPIFFAQSGTIQLGNFLLQHGAAIGGPGGGSDSYDEQMGAQGGGGGGGMGAGGALFINSAASVIATNLMFQNNKAMGGTGGNGGDPMSLGGGNPPTSGAGGGGMQFGEMAAGGGGTGSSDVGAFLGGGGGGGGSSPGLPGLWADSATSKVGTGGSGGGPFGGFGGNGTGLTGVVGGSGGNALGPFSGGGGGGGAEISFFSAGGAGGAGGDFGGGGGGGAGGNAIALGGAGGYGGGGGGASYPGGIVNYSMLGGAGGFGGGAGGGGGSGGALPGYGGGIGSSGGLGVSGGGGGGAGLGGAVFIREGGVLTVRYSSGPPLIFTGNTCQGGQGGNGASGGAAYGQDLFLSAGGTLMFVVDTPMTISSAISSNPDLLELSSPVIVQGSSILTLLGQNTFSGGVNVNQGGHLAIMTDQNLGLTAPGGGTLTLDQGTLQGMGATLTVGREVKLGVGGATVLTPVGGTVVFSKPISDIGSPGFLSVTGGGTLQLNGQNSYAGQTIIGPDTTVMISVPINLSYGITGPISGSGSLAIQHGIVTLGGTNTYGGTTTISPSGMLQIRTLASIPVNGAVVDNGQLIFQNTSGTAMPGKIAGIGLVSMDGTGGRVSLTGGNSYQAGTIFNSGIVQIQQTSALGGGALTFNGGLLELQSAFVGSISKTATLQSGGGSIQLDGVNVAYSGLIEGTGAFTLAGSGMLTLSALNTYMGNTVVGASTTLELLQVANLPTSSLVMDNGNVVFNTSSANAFIPNTIQGSGMVTLTGPSLFQLQYLSNTYDGGTILSLGTLVLDNFSRVGSGPITLLGGGTLELTAGSYSTSRSFLLGVGGGRIVLDSGASFALSGPISSSIGSPLAIEGPGTMTFSGTSNTSGLVTIGDSSLTGTTVALDGASLAGPVTVTTGSKMTGHGSVGALTNHGKIAMGSSDALLVTGNYTQSGAGTLEMRITGLDGSSEIHASGFTNLDGTLIVTAKPGVYVFGTTYTLLSSQDPLITTFSQVELPAFPQLELRYSEDPHVSLIVISQSVLDGAHVQGHNPQQVFGNLQAITHSVTSDLARVIEAMSDFDSVQLSAALDQLHPAPFGAFDLLNANNNSLLTSIFARHSAETCCLNLNEPCGYSDASVWVQPFGLFYNQDRVGEQLGFHAQSLGVAAGLNFSQMSGLLLGIGAAFSSSELTWHHGRGNGVMDKASVALYGDYTRENFSFETSILGSLDIFTASRHINFSTIHRHAKHQKGGQDLTAHVGGGGDFGIGAYSLRPFANLDYFYMYQKPFTEHGADSLNLEVKGKRSNMLRSELGLSATRSFKMGHGGCFAPLIFLSGINECFLLKRHYVSNFLDKNPSFRVRTWSHPIYLISPGAELSFLWNRGLSAGVRYSAELNARTCVQKLDARLEWFF